MTATDETYDDQTRAAEYVLRLLNPADHAAFETRMADDAALRRLVHDWEAHFATLADQWAPDTPPAHLRATLLRAIAPAETARRNGPFGWRSLLGGLAVTAVAAFLIIGTPLRQPELTPAFQAELATEDRSLVLTAAVIPATHEIVIERLAGDAPSSGVLELWLIAQDTPAPVSLGLIAAEGTTRITVPDDIAPGVRTGTIAISLEPDGGSPTGAPTGPVLATGTFTDL